MLLLVAPLVFWAPCGVLAGRAALCARGRRPAREIATREPDGSEWSISRPALALPLPTGTAARPSGPSGALHTSGAWCAGVWFGASPRSPAWPRSCLSNFARNSPANISNYEFVSLGFQRFWALL